MTTVPEMGAWRYTCELALIKGAARDHPRLQLPALACLSGADLETMRRVAHELALEEGRQLRLLAARRRVKLWEQVRPRCWGDLIDYSEALGRYEAALADVAGAEVAPHEEVGC